MGATIGIDLGTTNTAAAVFRGGVVEVLRNRLGEQLTPSAVALARRGNGLLVGRPAKDLWALAPDRGAIAFKRGIGRDRTWRLGKDALGAVELSAMLLRAVREDATAALGEPVTDCVITVPAYFNEEQRFATIKAGELAGLDVLRVLNEPTAAAMAYGAHRRASDGHVLVLDLGGGTFDVCVMEVFEGTLQVKATAGESRLGGEDFTRALAAHILEDLGSNFEQIEFRSPEATALLLKRCEVAKRALTDEDPVSITVPPYDGGPEAPLSVEVSRAEAEAVWEPLLSQLVGPCRRALRDAGLHARDLDQLLLVGGATRMPAIRRFAERTFERTPETDVDPDLAVVHGAALQAALVVRDEAVEDIVVTDVLSHSLGIGTTREVGSRHVDGYFSPIIHRNTVIPTSRVESYHTIHPNQVRMDLEVYEGESRRVSENRKIGSLLVEGIPKAPKGSQVDVRFTYDLNGLLEVEATIPATGETVTKVFTRDAAKLSQRDIARAQKRIDRIKADPRDVPAHRALLIRAELLWRELDGVVRSMLEEAIDAFETALEAREPRAIEGAAQALAELCERLDGSDPW